MNVKHISILILITCIIATAPVALSAGQEVNDQISAGEACFRKGELGHAAQFWEDALRGLKMEQNPGLYTDTLVHLAYVYKALGFHEKALSAFTDAMPAFKESDNRYQNALFFNNLADIHLALGGPLRLIPFSSLHDGKHFLIEKYAVGTVPALRLTSIGESETEKAGILLSGLSDAVQEFTPLPGVKAELADVKQIMNASRMLFNTDFTIPNLTGEFKDNPYGILHMATHGVFGGRQRIPFC
ncbi:MAG: hypothetical protein DRI57_22790 [Deltaproteobacteria bacterium]|nr:MAG: hypothetical protein DRI57_22790 [Deltaproteobacteria bacterium]